jgi:hypothetical protein
MGDYRLADEDLSCDKKRNKSLCEVAHLVIVVARTTEEVTHPIKKRNLCIRIVSPDHQDNCMDEDERIEEVREWESLICDDQYHESDDRREYLESPCEIVMWLDERPHECEDKCREKESDI